MTKTASRNLTNEFKRGACMKSTGVPFKSRTIECFLLRTFNSGRFSAARSKRDLILIWLIVGFNQQVSLARE
jgi:hypothetical protein